MPPEETAITRMVKEMGPLPLSESPYRTGPSMKGKVEDKIQRHAHVRLFYPSSSKNSGPDSFRPGLNSEGILYHDEAHDAQDVISSWLDANPDAIERSSPNAIAQSISWQFGGNFSGAVTEVLKDRGIIERGRDEA